MNNVEFFNKLDIKEKNTILTFARLYLSEFCFRGLSDPEPPVTGLPEAAQNYYYRLWTKLDVHVTRKTDIKYANELLAGAAEMAYQDNVVDTRMEEHLIGGNNEYADKQDWIESWLRELNDTVSTQSSKN